jgi:hypothetical protein
MSALSSISCSAPTTINNMCYRTISPHYQYEYWANESQAPAKGWHIPEKEVVGMTDNGTHVDVWLKGVGRRFVESLMDKSVRNVEIRIN